MVGGRMGTAAAGAAVLAVALALGGCAGGLSGVYGSAESSPTIDPSTERGAAPVRGDPSQERGAAPMRVDMDPEAECPQINVPAGTSSYSAYAGEASPLNVRFQARIAEFARECTLGSDNTVHIKVGVEGLVILGEKGAPGTFPAPLTISARDRDGTIISSQNKGLSVTIPPGATQATFRVIDDSITVPISFAKPLRSYEILVGFNAKGAAAAKKKRT